MCALRCVVEGVRHVAHGRQLWNRHGDESVFHVKIACEGHLPSSAERRVRRCRKFQNDPQNAKRQRRFDIAIVRQRGQFGDPINKLVVSVGLFPHRGQCDVSAHVREAMLLSLDSPLAIAERRQEELLISTPTKLLEGKLAVVHWEVLVVVGRDTGGERFELDTIVGDGAFAGRVACGHREETSAP